MLSKKAIDDFKTIWRKQFGEDISDEKATKEGINLLIMFDAIYRPIKKQWVDNAGDRKYKEKDKATPPFFHTP